MGVGVGGKRATAVLPLALLSSGALSITLTEAMQGLVAMGWLIFAPLSRGNISSIYQDLCTAHTLYHYAYNALRTLIRRYYAAFNTRWSCKQAMREPCAACEASGASPSGVTANSTAMEVIHDRVGWTGRKCFCRFRATLK